MPNTLPRDCSGSNCHFNLSEPIGPSYREAPLMMGWNVAAEELQHIPEHWLQYAAPNPLYNYVLGVVYMFLFVIALTGNGLVLWIFTTAKQLRTSSNFFVISLAIADFTMMLKTPIFIYNSFNQGFALGQFYCQVFGVMGSFAGITQATSNALIAYDRYKTISDPMGWKLGKGKAVILVLLAWAWSMPWTLMPLFEYWGRYVPEGFLTSCTFDYLTTTMDNRMFVFFIFIFSYCIPMFSIVFFYAQIVGFVVDHEKALKEQAKKMNVESLRSGDKANCSAEVRICKAAIGICFLFVLSWSPYAVVALIGGFGNQALITPLVSMIPALCCKLVACLDPYVYAISHPKYRNELQKRLPWLKINEPDLPAKETASQGTCATASA